jgi:hypothetical protein
MNKCCKMKIKKKNGSDYKVFENFYVHPRTRVILTVFISLQSFPSNILYNFTLFYFDWRIFFHSQMYATMMNTPSLFVCGTHMCVPFLYCRFIAIAAGECDYFTILNIWWIHQLISCIRSGVLEISIKFALFM